MASIARRGKQWRVRWRDPDGSGRSRGKFASKREAETFCREVEEAERAGRRWEPAAARRPADIGALVTAYVTDLARSRSPATVRTYGAHLNVVVRFLGRRASRPSREVLSRALLEELWGYVSDPATTAREGRSVRGRRAIVESAQRLWQWAYDHEDYGADVPRPRRIDMPEAPGKATTAPTWAQTDAVLALIRDDEELWRLCMVLRCMGLRASQGCAVEWTDFDLEARDFIFRGELGKSRQERRGRQHPFSPELAEAMAGWGRREGRVVSLQARTLDRPKLHEAWAAVGVESARCPFHLFRHGFVSGLRALGADVQAVDFLVGHALGLPGTYTAAWALRLREVVALVPAIGGARDVVTAIDARRA